MIETKNKSIQWFELVIRDYLIQWRVFIFLIHPLLEARAKKNVQNFVVFLEDGRTWYFAFDIYWPLDWPGQSYNNLCVLTYISELVMLFEIANRNWFPFQNTANAYEAPNDSKNKKKEKIDKEFEKLSDAS